MSGWQTVAVNGALVDALVVDFAATPTAQPSPFNGLPPDAELILQVYYESAAPSQVRLFLATGAGVARELQRTLYDSASQVNPAPDQTQSFNLCCSVPLGPGTNNWLSLRITKANVNARVDWRTQPKMGGGC